MKLSHEEDVVNATLAKLTQLTGDPPAADGPLLDAFIAGDESAFATLVRRHAPLVFATCRRILRHQHDAEDAFQATFLVLARRAADVWPREALGAWLFGVAHRVALKARAVRSRRATREQQLEDAASAERLGPECDLAEAVHRVVCRLPEVYRAAVIACDLEGLSRKEAAERLGWPEGTLSGRLARARELLATRFRRAGLTLPAGGLAAVFALPEGVSAQVIQATIDLATGAVAGASAPVAALTEGVVRSMALVKLKAMAAAVFAVGLIGFGAFAVGAGPGGDGTGDGQPKASQSQGGAPPAAPKKVEPPAKPVTDRERLQGTWRVVSLTEGEKTTPTNPKDPWVIEVSGGTLKMPYYEGGATSSTGTTDALGTSGSSAAPTSGTGDYGWKQREYTFKLDETRMPREIDLTRGTGAVGRGVYEFTATAKTCQSCHEAPNSPALGGGLGRPLDELLGLCGPGQKSFPLSVRMAISIDGKRPTKFGGDGVIVFELRRPADAKPQPHAGPRVDLARLELDVLRAELERELDGKDKLDKEKVARLIARLRAAEKLLEEGAKPPEKTQNPSIAVDQLAKAKAQLEQAQRDAELAYGRAIQAQLTAEVAQKALQDAQARVKAAEKALADANAKPKPEPVPADAGAFTVHVRTLTAAEKVTRVKLAGSQTVIDALAHADGVSLKPDAISVWVVREGAVMPVDLGGITLKGETKTNYQIRAGDQLFVQAKAAK